MQKGHCQQQVIPRTLLRFTIRACFARPTGCSNKASIRNYCRPHFKPTTHQGKRKNEIRETVTYIVCVVSVSFGSIAVGCISTLILCFPHEFENNFRIRNNNIINAKTMQKLQMRSAESRPT